MKTFYGIIVSSMLSRPVLLVCSHSESKAAKFLHECARQREYRNDKRTFMQNHRFHNAAWFSDAIVPEICDHPAVRIAESQSLE